MERDPTGLPPPFEADDWRPPAGERLFVADFRFGGGELPGFRPVRSSVPPVSPVAGTRAVTSVWQAGDGASESSSDALILADVIECDSAEAAGGALSELRAEFESLLIQRRDGPGDLAFAHDEGAVAFVRGNLAVRVMVGGPSIESVLRAAQDIDADLISRPDVEKARLAPEFVAPPAARATGKGPDARADLEIDVRDAQGRNLMLKVFTKTGSIARVDERLTFVPDSAGSHSIEVYAIAPDGDAARADIVVDTSK